MFFSGAMLPLNVSDSNVLSYLEAPSISLTCNLAVATAVADEVKQT